MEKRDRGYLFLSLEGSLVAILIAIIIFIFTDQGTVMFWVKITIAFVLWISSAIVSTYYDINFEEELYPREKPYKTEIFLLGLISPLVALVYFGGFHVVEPFIRFLKNIGRIGD